MEIDYFVLQFGLLTRSLLNFNISVERIKRTMPELTKDEIDLRKYEARLSLWKTGILGGLATIMAAIVGGIVSLMISSQETKGDLQLEELKSRYQQKLNLAKTENEYVDRFTKYALDENILVRLRFSEYMSIMAADDEQREKWSKYHRLMLKQLEEERTKLEELRKRSTKANSADTKTDTAD